MTERVAILGGGAAGLTAAFELTATPALRERYAVTVHTLGHRLGGKGASGRNAAAGQRIEEHGLHVWFGFYDNAFALMQCTYAELGRPPDAPLATWQDAFKPCNESVQYERWNGSFVSHRILFPGNPLTPGEPHERAFWDVAHEALRRCEFAWERVAATHAPQSGTAQAPSWIRSLGAAIEVRAGELERAGHADLLAFARRLAERQAARPPGRDHEHEPLVCRLLGSFRDWVWERVVAPRADSEPALRYFFGALDLLVTSLTGILDDRLLERGFAAADEEDLIAWLRRHGATEFTLAGSPLLHGLYDAAFAYRDGDPGRPDFAAGKGLQNAIRCLCLYKGALFYKMQAGMGDTVFAPLYEVLRGRGVGFEFFERVERLRLAASEDAVEEIEIARQARVRGGGEYQPLVDVKGLPCWPSEPLWEQLADADGGAQTLRRGADFDWVILAIPAPALAPLCAELSDRNSAFARMLGSTASVATQALQLWFGRPLTGDGGMGWRFSEDSIVGRFTEPLSAVCTMGQLLRREDWHDGDAPRDLVYTCGVLADADAADAARAAAVAERTASRWVEQDAGWLWPAAGEPGAFDESTIVARYVRANVSATERYVASFAGTIADRLAPDESGCSNLVLAGDWTRNGTDAGCVEAAVTSGMLAARAISGESRRVHGTSGWLASDRGEVVA